jgi:hypothetical protein
MIAHISVFILIDSVIILLLAKLLFGRFAIFFDSILWMWKLSIGSEYNFRNIIKVISIFLVSGALIVFETVFCQGN